jgi:hypothetical protein
VFLPEIPNAGTSFFLAARTLFGKADTKGEKAWPIRQATPLHDRITRKTRRASADEDLRRLTKPAHACPIRCNKPGEALMFVAKTYLLPLTRAATRGSLAALFIAARGTLRAAPDHMGRRRWNLQSCSW